MDNIQIHQVFGNQSQDKKHPWLCRNPTSQPFPHRNQGSSFQEATHDITSEPSVWHTEYATRWWFHKVKRFLQMRNIQYQVMIFQVQAAVFEFNHNLRHTDEVLRTRMQPQMAVPCEPLRRQIFDIGDADCIYGKEFLHRVAQWASTIFWESEPNHSTSYLELMLQFIYTTESLPPCPVAKYPERPSNKQKTWILKDKNPTYDFQGYTCQDILTSFIRTVKWAKRNLQADFFPEGVQMQVNALHIFHYKGFTGGVCYRAHLPDAVRIKAFCDKHLPYRKNLRISIPHVSSRN